MIVPIKSKFKFLPSKNLIVNTQKSIEELIQNLSSVTSNERSLLDRILRKRTDKKFEGKIEGRHFEIKRIIYYRNSFLPNITGWFENTSNGNLIHIQMQISGFVKAFLFLWFSVVLSVFLGFLAHSILTMKFHFLILIPLGMFSIFYGVIYLVFNWEANRSIKDLKATFPDSKMNIT